MRREKQDRYEVVSSTVHFDKIDDVTVHTMTDRRTGQVMFVTDRHKGEFTQDEIDAVFRIHYKGRERRENERRRVKIRRKKTK